MRDVPGTKPAHAALNALRATLGSLGARDFIELWQHPDDEAGNVCVRSRLQRHLQALNAIDQARPGGLCPRHSEL